jgi:hypothetical protein
LFLILESEGWRSAGLVPGADCENPSQRGSASVWNKDVVYEKLVLTARFELATKNPIVEEGNHR